MDAAPGDGELVGGGWGQLSSVLAMGGMELERRGILKLDQKCYVQRLKPKKNPPHLLHVLAQSWCSWYRH